MATDVKLDEVDGTYIVLDARVVKVDASDFMIDSPNRRKGGGPFRRALVHTEGDGLSVNFANDYPGGVTLNGVTEITPHQPNLVIHGGLSYEVKGITSKKHGSVKITINVDEEFNKLINQINELTARVAALESQLKK